MFKSYKITPSIHCKIVIFSKVILCERRRSWVGQVTPNKEWFLNGLMLMIMMLPLGYYKMLDCIYWYLNVKMLYLIIDYDAFTSFCWCTVHSNDGLLAINHLLWNWITLKQCNCFCSLARKRKTKKLENIGCKINRGNKNIDLAI